MEKLLVSIAVYGLAAGGLASILRALPWPAAWKQRKPLSCPLCMGWWCALLGNTASDLLGGPSGWQHTNDAVGWWTSMLALAGATGIAAVLNGMAVPGDLLPLPLIEDEHATEALGPLPRLCVCGHQERRHALHQGEDGPEYPCEICTCGAFDPSGFKEG